MIQSIRNIIIDTINKKSQKRKIVMWGGWDENSGLDKEIIEGCESDFAFYVTVQSNDKIKSVGNIKNISAINNKSEKYFVVIFPKETPESHIMFEKYGFKNNDLFYIHHKPITVKDVGKYADEYGNYAIIQKGCQVVFEGYNSYIEIDKVTIQNTLNICLSNNAKVTIGEGTKFVKEFTILARELIAEQLISPVIAIGNNCMFYNGRITSFSGKIEIDEECTFGDNNKIVAAYGMSISIGKDCMFSHDIFLLAGDGHLMYDLHTKQSINLFMNLPLSKQFIKIGEHVWIGLRACILNGTSIENGSVVGAGSLVKGSFTNNCVIVGNPAKLIRKDIAWSRQPVSDDIGFCGAEYSLFSK